MVGRLIVLLSLITSSIGCSGRSEASSSTPPSCDTSVRYTWDDTYAETRKTTEVINPVTNSCVQKRLMLSVYELGKDYRRRNHILCKPQSIASAWLKSDRNYYSERNDGRISLELDASTGQFRRISTGITSDVHQAGAGRPAFSRDLGCFYVRTASDGTQWLLLDLGPNKASTEESKSSEVFRYTINGNAWITSRMDDNADVDGTMCPASLVPEPYCEALRAALPYHIPDLDAATEGELLQETLLLRSEYNYVQMTKGEFDSLWNQAEQSFVETPLQAFKFEPLLTSDVPIFLEALADYVRGARSMPDITITMPTVCAIRHAGRPSTLMVQLGMSREQHATIMGNMHSNDRSRMEGSIRLKLRIVAKYNVLGLKSNTGLD